MSFLLRLLALITVMITLVLETVLVVRLPVSEHFVICMLHIIQIPSGFFKQL